MTLSTGMRRAIFAQQTDADAAVLVTFGHADLAAPVLLSSHPGRVPVSIDPLEFGIVSRGETYRHALLSVSLPDDKEGAAPRARVSFDNVDRSMVELLRTITGVPQVKFEIVMVDAPDAVEVRYDKLEAFGVTYGDDSVSFEVSRELISTEPWPCDKMSKARFAGLHR